jgi:hypothetical protein
MRRLSRTVMAVAVCMLIHGCIRVQCAAEKAWRIPCSEEDAAARSDSAPFQAVLTGPSLGTMGSRQSTSD